MVREQKVIGREISEIRRERLAALFAADEKKYEEELYERDLTFRKERF